MANKRAKPEETVTKLQQVEVLRTIGVHLARDDQTNAVVLVATGTVIGEHN